jgi:hypothetical protein
MQEERLLIDKRAKIADDFDQRANQTITHTFFGADEETGLNMLVQEQKQLEKMQAYSF